MTSIPVLKQTTKRLSPLQAKSVVTATHTAPLGGNYGHASLPELKVSKPIKIPTGVSSNSKQHVILVRDCSSSMSGNKIAELNLASSGLIHELANPKNKDGFLVRIIEFSNGSLRSVFAESTTALTIPQALAVGEQISTVPCLKRFQPLKSLKLNLIPVSYTHLTLPTICSV